MEPPPLRTARELSFRIHSNTWKLRGITRTKNPSIIRGTHPDECNQLRIHWNEYKNVCYRTRIRCRTARFTGRTSPTTFLTICLAVIIIFYLN